MTKRGTPAACTTCGRGALTPHGAQLSRRVRAPVPPQSSADAPPIVHDVLRSPGQPLDPAARAFMEPRFGHDLSAIRIHHDSTAARSVQAQGASAYAIGRDLVFGTGQYAPHTPAGRKLLAHELTHAVQQNFSPNDHLPAIRTGNNPATETEARRAGDTLAAGRSFRPALRVSPQIACQHPPTGIIPENPYDAEVNANEFARLTISVVRDPIIEALRRRDSVDFLNRLRSAVANQRDRALLETDPVLKEALEREFAGSPRSLWISRRLLHFGINSPEYIRAFENAVTDHDTAAVLRYLRTFPQLHDEHQTPGVRDWLTGEYRGRGDSAAVLGELAVTETSRMERPLAYSDEIHYELNQSTGRYALWRASPSEHYDLVRAGNQLRVNVRMRLVQGADQRQTYYPSSELASRWLGGIERIWNGHFVFANGAQRLDVVFVPIFTESQPHYTIAVYNDNARGSAGSWREYYSGGTVAHEFGHLIGNPDEYNLPATAAEISPADRPAFDAGELGRTTWQGLTGQVRPATPQGYTAPNLMGDMYVHTNVEVRHANYILTWFNAHMLSAGEAAYHTELH
jgi:Domain of unknown function (DUF4157)